LYDLVFSAAEHFGLSPFQLRRERAREFFDVYIALTRYLKHQAKHKNKPQVIRKPAGDNWF
jgi:hypothetical protein